MTADSGQPLCGLKSRGGGNGRAGGGSGDAAAEGVGWGAKRIARELGVNRRTVKRYLETGGWHPYKKHPAQRLHRQLAAAE
jgi:hypothetical protein